MMAAARRVGGAIRSTVLFVQANGVATLESYIGLIVNLVSGFYVYLSLAPLNDGQVYASLSLNVYSSTIFSVTAFSFQARAIEESAGFHSLGQKNKATVILCRYESLSVILFLFSLAISVILGTLYICAIVRAGSVVLSLFVLGNCLAATNGSRHALLFSTGDALRVARLQRVHAVCRLSLLCFLFSFWGPSPMAVAIASVGGSAAAVVRYRTSLQLPFNRRRLSVRWLRKCLRGWNKVFNPPVIGSLLTRNIDSLQGACEQVALGMINPALRVSYSLMIPFMSLVKQGAYAYTSQIESKYAACLRSGGIVQSAQGLQLLHVVKTMGMSMVILASIALAAFQNSGLVPRRIVEALGPRLNDLWAIPVALVMFPFCLSQAWVFLYCRRADVFIWLYCISLLISVIVAQVVAWMVPSVVEQGLFVPIGFVVLTGGFHYLWTRSFAGRLVSRDNPS
jgi:hypothetical protein